MSTVVFRRPPRQAGPPLPRGEILLESPPELPEQMPKGIGPLLMMLPMLAGVGAMAFMYSGGQNNTRMMVTGALFGVSMLGMAIGQFSSGGGEKRAELDAAAARLHALPGAGPQAGPAGRGPAAHGRAVAPPRAGRAVGGGRLPPHVGAAATDDDFAEIRMAVGRAAARRVGGHAGDQAGRGPRTDDGDRSAPVRPGTHERPGSAHRREPALVLAGWSCAASGEPVTDLARAMLAQLVTFHSPDDLRIAVVAAEERQGDWDWVKWLPHSQYDRVHDAAGPVRLVFTTMADLEAMLEPELAERPRHSPEARRADLRRRTSIVVLDGGEVNAAGSLHGVGLLGTTVIDLSGMVSRDAGRWLLSLDVTADAVEVDQGKRSTRLGRPDRVTAEQIAGLARHLAPFRLSTQTASDRRAPGAQHGAARPAGHRRRRRTPTRG